MTGLKLLYITTGMWNNMLYDTIRITVYNQTMNNKNLIITGTHDKQTFILLIFYRGDGFICAPHTLC